MLRIVQQLARHRNLRMAAIPLTPPARRAITHRLLLTVLAVFVAGAIAGAGVTLLFQSDREPVAHTPPLPVEPVASPAERPTASPLAVAPPPREAEDSRRDRSHYEDWAIPAGETSDTKDLLVHWRVRVGVRRLVSTGKDLIEFHWGVKYSGRRTPFIMLRPSFTESWPGATQAEFFAFPAGAQMGRLITILGPNDPGQRLGIWELPPAGWFLETAREEWESGRETVAVSDLKEVLRSKFPGDFSGDRPPKLYTRFRHRAALPHMDAWTGELESHYLEIPELKKW